MHQFLFKPDRSKLFPLLDRYRLTEYTYRNPGSTLTWPRKKFVDGPAAQSVDGDMVLIAHEKVGRGKLQFAALVNAIKSGKVFDLAWTDGFHKRDFEIGDPYCIRSRKFGIWVVCFCRVIYLDECETEKGTLFSMGIGTLKRHVAIGEERFSAFLDRETGDVYFMIGSFSRPGNWKTKLVARTMRRLQVRFGEDCTQRMREVLSKVDSATQPELQGVRS